MRILLLGIFLLALLACSESLHIHVSNKSDSTLSHLYSRDTSRVETIRPGERGVLYLRPRPQVCFEMTVDSTTVAFHVPEIVTSGYKSTAYGGRIDAVFAENGLRVKSESSDWVELDQTRSCDAE